jgi:antitoxin Phd
MATEGPRKRRLLIFRDEQTSLMTSHFHETSMKTWPVQDAKARFSELLETCLREGPQMVTRRGQETAVLVPIDHWTQLEKTNRPTLKELLLADLARTDDLVPPRRKWRRRRPIEFD